jgi:hypothetical protein
MNFKLFSIVILAGLLAAAKVAAQEDTNAPPANDWNSFSTIARGNIFSPSRRPRTSTTPVRYTPTPRTDYFTLVGTMSYEKGQYAFFEGSSSSYRKTLNVGQTIAGYKIAQISADNIQLAANSNLTITLPVGTQMRRPEGGRWSVAGRDAPTPVASAPVPDASTNSGTNAAPDSAAPAAAGGSASDLIKQMMLRRMNEK